MIDECAPNKQLISETLLTRFLMVASLPTAAVPKNKNILQRAPNYCIQKLRTPQVLGNFKTQISIQSANLSSSQSSTTQHWKALLDMIPLVGHLEVAEKRANLEPVDIHMRRQKWGWIGHTLRKDEKCNAMEWNPLISTGRLPARPR